ncbi:hypothetical protein HKD37_19G053223 [Glycine soja]
MEENEFKDHVTKLHDAQKERKSKMEEELASGATTKEKVMDDNIVHEIIIDLTNISVMNEVLMYRKCIENEKFSARDDRSSNALMTMLRVVATPTLVAAPAPPILIHQPSPPEPTPPFIDQTPPHYLHHYLRNLHHHLKSKICYDGLSLFLSLNPWSFCL